MVEEFNAKYEKTQLVRKKRDKEKLAKLSERRRKKEKNKRSTDSLEFKTQLEEDEEEAPKKAAKLSPEAQPSASISEEAKSIQAAAIDKAKLELQKAALEEAIAEVKIPMETVKMIRGNLALDVAVKIVGCRKQGKTVMYAVLFKKRSDEGVVVIPQICTHEELKVQAPWLLSQYLLDYARTDQIA